MNYYYRVNEEQVYTRLDEGKNYQVSEKSNFYTENIALICFLIVLIHDILKSQ